MPAVTIHTTQNVRIDYEAAGVGLRIGAFLIDGVVVLISFILLFLAVTYLEIAPDPWILVRYGTIFYLIGYFFLWELFSRGQSAGKKLLHLRVIRLDGEDPTPGDFLVRSIFLLIDVIFTGGVLAVLLVMTGARNQRLGDIVARTVVIHTRRQGGVNLRDILTIRHRDQHEARYVAVQRMNDEDMLLVKQTLSRYRHYGNRAHRDALRLLADRMAEILEVGPGERLADHEEFLERLLLDYIVLTR